MSENDLKFENFLKDIHPVYHEFVTQTDAFLAGNGCKIKLDMAKNGYLVSYSHAKSKHVILNFVFRKGGLVIRVYGNNVNKYAEILADMPEGMITAIRKAPACKRLADPNACSSRCSKGYEFGIKDESFQKCRYNCFMFEINDENIPFIKTFIENEVGSRG